jgi:hypothetical protein
VLTEGEPLSKEHRFRLRGYTVMTIGLFLVSHLTAYFTLLDITRCQAYPIAYLDVATIHLALYGLLAVLYLIAWIEVIRMLYVRWWPHWGTLAPKTNVFEAARPALPMQLRMFIAVGLIAYFTITSCESFAPGNEPSSDWSVGVFVAIMGSFVGAYGSWLVRVLEPFGSIASSKTP